MKSLILILALSFSGAALAEDVQATQAEKDTFMVGICDVVAKNYALGEAWERGEEGVNVSNVKTTPIVNDRLAITVSTFHSEDYLMVAGKNASFFCYRCGDFDVRVSLESKASEACK